LTRRWQNCEATLWWPTNSEFRLRQRSPPWRMAPKSGSSAALDAAADEIIASDPSLLALKSSLSTKRAVLLDQLAGMTANHPMRKSTEAQLTEIESALQQMQANLRNHAAANLQQKLRTDLKRASTVEAQLQSDLQSNTHQATHAAPSFQRALVLKAEITALQARYAAMDERTRNLELESKSPGSVHMFSAARSAESTTEQLQDDSAGDGSNRSAVGRRAPSFSSTCLIAASIRPLISS
jgi:hypothetical protein